MDYTTIITCIMTSITTIAVATLGIIQNRKQKENEEYKKLREELEAERDKRAQEKEEMEEKRIAQLEETVKTLSENVNTLTENVKDLTEKQLDELHDQLKNLHKMQTENFMYIQSMANIVSTIGESLTSSKSSLDENMKEEITKSIKDHKKTEQALAQKLYNIVV